MKMRVFLLLLYLSVLTSCHHYENVYQVLASRGFGGRGFLVCQLREGNVVKNINKDELNLLETLKRSKIVGKTSPVPLYTISFENGSSWPWEKITIYTDRSGDGYVDYRGRRVAFFNCADLPKFCEQAFNRNSIILH
jgi:hypothetical protein